MEEGLVKEYIQQLERNAIAPLIEVLGELKNMRARKVIIDGLAILGKRDIESLVKGLSDERWYVVRNIVYILRLIGDKRSVEYLLKTIRHPDMRVRREVIKTLGAIHTESAKKLLLQRINTKDFLHRSMEEKKEYFEVLSSWKDEEVIFKDTQEKCII